jgi:glutamate synthase domain-containing protein 2
MVFTDHVSLPFRLGFSRVYSTFARQGLADRVVIVGSSKLGMPDNALVAFALGADMVTVAREAMLAIGCIQAQKCHTDTCPTGVATQSPWLARGLDPELKSVRAANDVKTLRRDLLRVAQACGVEHPGLVRPDDLELLSGRTTSTPLGELYGYANGWGLPSAADQEAIRHLMAGTAPTGDSAPPSPTAAG